MASSGQVFDDVDSIVQKIMEENQSNKFRMCSLHLSAASYQSTKTAKLLKSSAIPSIFQRPLEGEKLIDISIKKAKMTLKRCYEISHIATLSADTTASPSAASEMVIQPGPSKCSVASQTECTLINCVVTMNIKAVSRTVHNLSETNFPDVQIHSTPLVEKHLPAHTRGEFGSPLTKRRLLHSSDTTETELPLIDIGSFAALSPSCPRR